MFAIFFMKSGFNTIIPLEDDKTVTAKWHTEECLSNVLKQVEKHRRLNDLIIHHDNASSHKATQTMEYLEGQLIKLMGHPALGDCKTVQVPMGLKSGPKRIHSATGTKSFFQPVAKNFS